MLPAGEKRACAERSSLKGMIKQYLRIENVGKTYDEGARNLTALQGVGLTVEKGEFVSIVGASGCGKSTLLRLICGLDNDYTGSIHVNGKRVTAPGLHCGMVFQDHRLLPWLTVEENIDFALHGRSKSQRKELVGEYLSLVGLSGAEKILPGPAVGRDGATGGDCTGLGQSTGNFASG